MGDIIDFRLAAASARPRKPAAGAAIDCRILLFTGIRYERHADAAVEAPASESPSGSTKGPVGSKRGKKQA